MSVLDGVVIEFVEESSKGSLFKVYDVKIPLAQLEKKDSVELAKIKENSNIPGFRKGAAPDAILKSRYGKDVRKDSVYAVVREVVSEICQKNNFKLALQPNVVFKNDITADIDLALTIELSILPEPNDVDLSSILLKTYKITPSESDVEKSVSHFLKTKAEYVETDVVKMGDRVTLDCTGRQDGVEFKEGRVENYELEIGSKSFIDTFEEQLIDCKAGDKKFVNVTFPSDYHATNLAGKPAEFEVDIKKITTPKIPELNDDLVKKSFGKENVEEFRSDIRENVKKYYQSLIRNSIKNKVFDKILEKLDFELPSKLFEALRDDVTKKELEANERKPEHSRKSDIDIIEGANKKAKDNLLLSLFLNHYSAKNNIDVSEQDIYAAVMEEANRLGMNPFEFVKMYNNSDQSGNALKEFAREAKIYEDIFSKISISYHEITKEDFDKLAGEQNFSFIME